MAQDKNAQMRNLIAGYRDSMTLSDIKALIAVLFVAIMMGTVLQYRAHYPWYLSPLVILSPGGNTSQCGATLFRSIFTSSPILRPISKGSPLYARVSPASSGGRT